MRIIRDVRLEFILVYILFLGELKKNSSCQVFRVVQFFELSSLSCYRDPTVYSETGAHEW
jgi:hypothetical protein